MTHLQKLEQLRQELVAKASELLGREIDVRLDVYRGIPGQFLDEARVSGWLASSYNDTHWITNGEMLPGLGVMSGPIHIFVGAEVYNAFITNQPIPDEILQPAEDEKVPF